MAGIGTPEVIVIGVIVVFIYGVIMTVDAVRRPAGKYGTGNKKVWVSVLLLSNPFISKYYPGLFYLIGIITFIAASIAYHVLIRNRKTVPESIKDSREEGMQKRFESREK